MPIEYTPPPRVFPAYDPIGTPVQFELISQSPKTPFIVSVLSGLPQSWNATGIYNAPPGVTFPVYTPPGAYGYTTDGMSLIRFAGALITHIDSVTATENQDGTGASFDLTAKTTLYGPRGTLVGNPDIPTLGLQFDAAGVLYAILMDIPDPPTVYVQSVRMTGYRLYEIQSVSHPPPNPPPSVTGGNTLDTANPGFTAELHRDLNYWNDLVEVFLGQRVNLTVESEGSRLGFHGRGHIITIVDMEMKSELQGGVKVETIDWTYTVEKIPGTLLPGTGTSTPAQDALGTGAEIPLFAIISNAVPTIGVANLG